MGNPISQFDSEEWFDGAPHLKPMVTRAMRKKELPIDDKIQAHRTAWSSRPPILKNTHRVINGDAREMREIAKSPVHLVVTSPPYWNLKEYNSDSNGAQLGHIRDRKEFLNELNKVWSSCFKLLVPGGRLCVIVGDVCRSRKNHGRHLVEPLHAYIQVECQKIGFDPLAPIIWNKISNMKTEVAGNGAGFLGKPYEPNAIIKNDIEFILFFRKPGAYRHPTQEQRDLSLISKEDHKNWFRQIWDDLPGEIQRDHPAPYPMELARRLIGMFSFVGDTVLDPFWGLGNTTLAAMHMHRSSIGYEIDGKYIQSAKKKFMKIPRDSKIDFVE